MTNSMIKESKYCGDVIKKHFRKELVVTKGDNEGFKNFSKCWICDNDYINDVKVRVHCQFYCEFNINIKLNHKIPAMFHNLRSYDSLLIMEELGKFNLKISVIPNRLERYMSFTINDKLSFIDSFQFLSSSLDSLLKNLGNFKYLSQEFCNNVLDLVKQK